jgi:hypothetical protein
MDLVLDNLAREMASFLSPFGANSIADSALPPTGNRNAL